MEIKLEKGLSEKTIKFISQIKKEPLWVLEKRLFAYQQFCKLKNPNWGLDLSFINFNDYIYYASQVSEKKDWKDVPINIKKQFKALKIPTNEAKALSGVHSQFDSSGVFNSMVDELKKKKVIFCSTDEAIIKYPQIFKKYLGKIVSASDNKYAALNTAVWAGGSFLYVPKNVKIDKPVQSYFRINSQSVGQFERTLIIVEENSEVHYMEGCTAPIYDTNNLHAAVVEVFVGKNAKMRYSTIQNWSNNVLNLVTKRALVEENGYMEWIDGNIGSKINMKYPCSILKGNNSQSKCISIATASNGIQQDSGAKVIHLGKNTRSYIMSRSIANKGGNASFRCEVNIGKDALNSYSEIICDTILLDKGAKSDVYPTEVIQNNSSFIKHEAKASMIDKNNLFYLMSKGLDEKTAKHLTIIGFIEPFAKELPIEYAVELNRLLSQYF